MTQPAACPLPADALLQACVAEGAYADCFYVDIGQAVSLSQFVTAFYTTGVFRIERWLLKVLVSRPSTDAEAGELACGQREDFAVWQVAQRTADQLLLAESIAGTRSWFRVVAGGSAGAPGTRLYFGSAVMPKPNARGDTRQRSRRFNGLLWFHQLYSRVLLGAARGRLLAKASS